MYPAALHKIPTQTVDSPQVLATVYAKSNRKQSRVLQKIGTKTIKDLEQVCPKQDHNLLSTFWSSKTILSKLMISVWSGI